MHRFWLSLRKYLLDVFSFLWDNNNTMSGRVEYWLELCDSDLSTARVLFQAGHYLPMSFYCHMIVEKALKAVVARKTGEIPPRIHDLDKLAIRGGIYETLSEKQLVLLKDLGPLQIEARYPGEEEMPVHELTSTESEQILKETEEFLCWIKQKLEK